MEEVIGCSLLNIRSEFNSCKTRRGLLDLGFGLRYLNSNRLFFVDVEVVICKSLYAVLVAVALQVNDGFRSCHGVMRGSVAVNSMMWL